MNKIITFFAVAGIAFTAHAADPSFYDNERPGLNMPIANAAAPSFYEEGPLRMIRRMNADAVVASEAHNPLTTGYGPPVNQD